MTSGNHGSSVPRPVVNKIYVYCFHFGDHYSISSDKRRTIHVSASTNVRRYCRCESPTLRESVSFGKIPSPIVPSSAQPVPGILNRKWPFTANPDKCRRPEGPLLNYVIFNIIQRKGRRGRATDRFYSFPFFPRQQTLFFRSRVGRGRSFIILTHRLDCNEHDLEAGRKPDRKGSGRGRGLTPRINRENVLVYHEIIRGDDF